MSQTSKIRNASPALLTLLSKTQQENAQVTLHDRHRTRRNGPPLHEPNAQQRALVLSEDQGQAVRSGPKECQPAQTALDREATTPIRPISALPAPAPSDGEPVAPVTAAKLCGLKSIALTKQGPGDTQRSIEACTTIDRSNRRIALVAPCGDDPEPSRSSLLPDFGLIDERPGCGHEGHDTYTVNRGDVPPTSPDRLGDYPQKQVFDKYDPRPFQIAGPAYRSQRKLLRKHMEEKPPGTLGWWIGDFWLESVQPTEFRVWSSSCGDRESGAAQSTSHSQNTTVSVYPDDRYELDFELPELIKLEYKSPESSDQAALDLDDQLQLQSALLEKDLSASIDEDAGVIEVVTDLGGMIRERIKPTLTCNDRQIDTHVTRAISFLHHFATYANAAVKAAGDLATYLGNLLDLLPSAKLTYSGKVSSLTGRFKASWGWREIEDGSCAYGFHWQPSIDIIDANAKLTGSFQLTKLLQAIEDLDQAATDTLGQTNDPDALERSKKISAALRNINPIAKLELGLSGRSTWSDLYCDSNDILQADPTGPSSMRSSAHQVLPAGGKGPNAHHRDPKKPDQDSPSWQKLFVENETPGEQQNNALATRLGYQPEADRIHFFNKKAITLELQAKAATGSDGDVSIKMWNETPIDVIFSAPTESKLLNLLRYKLKFLYEDVDIYASYRLGKEEVYLGKGNEEYNAHLKRERADSTRWDDEDESQSSLSATRQATTTTTANSSQKPPCPKPLAILMNGNKTLDCEHKGLVERLASHPSLIYISQALTRLL